MTCATEPCDAVTECALVGGCVVRRFPQRSVSEPELTPEAKKPARKDRKK